MSEVRSHYPMPDDAASPTCEIWREAAIDPEDGAAVEKREQLRSAMFAVFFGPEKERAEGAPLPFSKLPAQAVKMMPAGLRADYDAELAAALDPRSGRRVPA